MARTRTPFSPNAGRTRSRAESRCCVGTGSVGEQPRGPARQTQRLGMESTEDGLELALTVGCERPWSARNGSVRSADAGHPRRCEAHAGETAERNREQCVPNRRSQPSSGLTRMRGRSSSPYSQAIRMAGPGPSPSRRATPCPDARTATSPAAGSAPAPIAGGPRPGR